MRRDVLPAPTGPLSFVLPAATAGMGCCRAARTSSALAARAAVSFAERPPRERASGLAPAARSRATSSTSPRAAACRRARSVRACRCCCGLRPRSCRRSRLRPSACLRPALMLLRGDGRSGWLPAPGVLTPAPDAGVGVAGSAARAAEVVGEAARRIDELMSGVSVVPSPVRKTPRDPRCRRTSSGLSRVRAPPPAGRTGRRHRPRGRRT